MDGGPWMGDGGNGNQPEPTGTNGRATDLGSVDAFTGRPRETTGGHGRPRETTGDHDKGTADHDKGTGDHGNHIPQGHQKPCWKPIKNIDNLNFFFQIKIRPFCTPVNPGFRYHGPKYYTTSNWLGPGNGFENVMKESMHKVQNH